VCGYVVGCGVDRGETDVLYVSLVSSAISSASSVVLGVGVVVAFAFAFAFAFTLAPACAFTLVFVVFVVFVFAFASDFAFVFRFDVPLVLGFDSTFNDANDVCVEAGIPRRGESRTGRGCDTSVILLR
jgi:hypothetical protein